MSNNNQDFNIKKYLKSKHLSATKSRAAVSDIIFETHSHFKVQDIIAALKKSKIAVSRATVYRTIEIMLEAGVIHKYVDAENNNFYEHTFGHKHHDHLICVKCGRVIEFNDNRIEKIQKEICDKLNFKILNHLLKINGVCDKCDYLN